MSPQIWKKYLVALLPATGEKMDLAEWTHESAYKYFYVH